MSLLRILPFLFAALLSAQAFAQTSPAPPVASGEENSHYGWADVLRVDPIYADDASSPPPQPCYEEQVPVDAPADSEVQNKRGIFTAIGAFVGGILGNQFGKGSGRAAATVAGAVACSAIVHAIQNQAGTGFNIVVRTNDGRTLTAMQDDLGAIRVGSYVEVRNGHAYLR